MERKAKFAYKSFIFAMISVLISIIFLFLQSSCKIVNIHNLAWLFWSLLGLGVVSAILAIIFGIIGRKYKFVAMPGMIIGIVKLLLIVWEIFLAFGAGWTCGYYTNMPSSALLTLLILTVIIYLAVLVWGMIYLARNKKRLK